MKIKALIEKTDTGYCSISCNEKIGNFCLGGFGNSVAEAKDDFMSVVKEAQEEYVAEHGELPDKYKDVSVTYQYDLQSFFDCFDWINITKFAQVAGVNESKLRLYKVGKAFAGERTKAKLQSAIKRMSAELASVSL